MTVLTLVVSSVKNEHSGETNLHTNVLLKTGTYSTKLINLSR